MKKWELEGWAEDTDLAIDGLRADLEALRSTVARLQCPHPEGEIEFEESQDHQPPYWSGRKMCRLCGTIFENYSTRRGYLKALLTHHQRLLQKQDGEKPYVDIVDDPSTGDLISRKELLDFIKQQEARATYAPSPQSVSGVSKREFTAP